MTNSPISSELSTREQQVLSLILSGSSYAQIAQKLSISIETVRKHAHNAYTKMQVRGKSAARKAMESDAAAV